MILYSVNTAVKRGPYKAFFVARPSKAPASPGISKGFSILNRTSGVCLALPMSTRRLQKSTKYVGVR